MKMSAFCVTVMWLGKSNNEEAIMISQTDRFLAVDHECLLSICDNPSESGISGQLNGLRSNRWQVNATVLTRFNKSSPSAAR